MMSTKQVTCPETGHPEEIRYLAEPDGRALVVLRCSRFDPPEAIACGWTCANRMDCATALEAEKDHSSQIGPSDRRG